MRWAMKIEYDGAAYHGWQRQSHASSVQSTLEASLSQIADTPIQVVCAGRTDAGVHARGQVIHFDTEAERESIAWIRGTNRHLPNDIRITHAVQVPEDFHARFDAIARRYRYVIYNHPLRPALEYNRVAWFYKPLDIEPMQQAALSLIGEHDFSSFRAAGCQAHSPIRTVTELQLQRDGDYIYLDIQANAFLQHMVRNIAGVLSQIGQGDYPTSWIEEVLSASDRTQGGVTAPPGGLYFEDAIYPIDLFT